MQRILLTFILVAVSVTGFAIDFSIKFINNTQEELKLAPLKRTEGWTMGDLERINTIPAGGEVTLKTRSDSSSAKSGLATISVISGEAYLGEIIEIWQNFDDEDIKAKKNVSRVLTTRPWMDSSLIYSLGIGSSNDNIVTTLNEDGAATVTFKNPQQQMKKIQQAGIMPWKL